MGWFRLDQNNWIVKHYGDGEKAAAKADRECKAGECIVFDVKVTSSGQRYDWK